jgi:crossover junction endodeoxyribonuclease RusA
MSKPWTLEALPKRYQQQAKDKLEPKVAETLRGRKQPRRVELVLPFPPSTNNIYFNGKKGRVLTDKGREYHKTVAEYVAQQKADVMFTGRLAMYLIFYPPDNRRRDLSNFVKALENGLKNAGVYKDDSLIDELKLVRGEARAFGIVNVVVRAL